MDDLSAWLAEITLDPPLATRRSRRAAPSRRDYVVIFPRCIQPKVSSGWRCTFPHLVDGAFPVGQRWAPALNWLRSGASSTSRRPGLVTGSLVHALRMPIPRVSQTIGTAWPPARPVPRETTCFQPSTSKRRRPLVRAREHRSSALGRSRSISITCGAEPSPVALG